MLKTKYLHRRRKKNNHKDWYSKKNNRCKNIYHFDNLPNRESIRKNKNTWNFVDCSPLYEFLYSKVGLDWNDIYSEINRKIKHKYKYVVKYYLENISKKTIFDENFIPFTQRGIIRYNDLFVDSDNILTFKNKEQILLDSKKKLRTKKILEIEENINKEQQNQHSD